MTRITRGTPPAAKRKIAGIQCSRYCFAAESVSAPVRFAFLSDIHNYPAEPILAVLKELCPDAVLIGGDFIQGADAEPGVALLREVAGAYPTFCSTGKEFKFGRELTDRVTDTGAVLLRNRSVNFRGVEIGGLDTQPLTHKPEPERERLIARNRAWLEEFCRKEDYRLLLCHHPEYFDYVREYPVRLMVAGHAHGGQWRLFGRGVFAPGQGLLPRYTAGLYEQRLLVGRGIGNSHRVPRINNPPEILEIRIDPKIRRP